MSKKIRCILEPNDYVYVDDDVDSLWLTMYTSGEGGERMIEMSKETTNELIESLTKLAEGLDE